jgi:2-phospho-L-lactate guanylyltransferase
VTSSPPRPWTVIVPVKSSARAKSRLRLDPDLRRALARSMARDTISAVVSAPVVGGTVLVVEDAEDGAPLAGGSDVRIVVTRTRDLNAAIMDGLAQADITGPVAVVPADLPSLTPAELTEALTTAAGHPAGVVADRAGTGTTLLTARAPVHLRPRYGEGSFRRHVAAGAVPLPIPAGSGLRRDVELAADLPTVTGSATRTLLDEFGRVPVRFTR